MEESFTFKCNHLIGHFGDVRALIDTGCPASFGEVPAVTVAGRTHELRRSITRPDGIEITVAKIRDTAAAAGYLLDISCLVGMDILGAQPVTFDMRRRVLDFDGEPPFGCNAPLEIVAGIPVLRVQVLGLAIRCVLDTAAVPCFLPKRPRPSIDPVREEREFSPLLDEPFLSPIRVLPVTLFEREFHLEVGELPQILEDDLSTAEIDGVIGNKLLESGKVTVDIPAGQAVFEPYSCV